MEIKQCTFKQSKAQRRDYEENQKILLNENTTYEFLRDAEKVVFKGKFVAVNTYIKKSKTDNLTFHFKELEIDSNTEDKLVVGRTGQTGERENEVQISNYKISKSPGLKAQHREYSQ